MSFQLPVVVTDDFLNRIKASPISALNELLWNGLDADASIVDISYEATSMGAIEQVIIKDNGHGIDFSTVNQTFGFLGGSKKQQQCKTQTGRAMHGKKGSGRYLALSIGRNITWQSVYRKEDGQNYRFEINCDADNPNIFNISDENPTDAHTGVAVVITCIRESVSNQLNNREKLLLELNKTFAPYLLTFTGIKIVVDGLQLQPEKMIEDNVTIGLMVKNENDDLISGQIKIIRWKNNNVKTFYACSLAGVPYDTISLNVDTGRMPITAYLCSEYIERIYDNNLIMDTGYELLCNGMKGKIKEYYRNWVSCNAIQTVNKLKEEGTYPYKGAPKTELDLAERQVFDICLVNLNEAKPDIFSMPKAAKSLTMGLIKEALHQNPTNLKKVLKEVLNLSERDLGDLVDILEKTTLNSIISTTKMIGDRLKFLNGLEQMIYSKEYSKYVRERSQLHKILLNELWIFGEQYALGVSDQKLYNALKDYAKFLNREELAMDLLPEEVQSMSDIPDICLWQQYSLGRADTVENLVIELKRPSVVISDVEIAQIKRYALTVADNPRFPKEKTNWTFLLVSSDIDKFARFGLREINNIAGVSIDDQNIRVIVKDWGQIISEAHARYKFLEEKLSASVTNNEGIKYLQERYSKLLPNCMLETASALEK
ncbi:ATP-binding protein [Pelosinus fermentans]|uniref:Uncharacterized protein n=1 Tax=Pelosinus fermentans JBW45 TaxID=1192197 RepID=I9DCI8_9FIRM|nr:ATP-binding protein [Pelosinus fermentans]AJQ26937.1 hypothetical protein JBW_01587 [Pelosinus fermentans JBW45]